MKNKLDYLLTVDEFNKSEGQLTLPVSIFLYLISSDKFFYELSWLLPAFKSEGFP